MKQNRQPKGIPAGGEFATHDRADSDVALTRPHANETPAEVDAQLVVHLEAAERARSTIRAINRSLESYRKQESFYYQATIERLERQLEEAEHEEAVAEAAAAPMELEYAVRGGWPRFFLVTNSGGHVHSSMNCSTCYPTTRFAWLPDLSGSDEQQVIDAAGDGACTVCFPNAPVADPARPRPNQIETPTQRASREEREAKRAAAEAKRKATGIWTPVGGELLSEGWINRDGLVSSRHPIKTERTAQIEAVDAIVSQARRERWREGEPEDERALLQRAESEAFVARAVEALAHKRGVPEAEVRAEIEKKAAAKIKKEMR